MLDCQASLSSLMCSLVAQSLSKGQYCHFSLESQRHKFCSETCPQKECGIVSVLFLPLQTDSECPFSSYNLSLTPGSLGISDQAPRKVQCLEKRSERSENRKLWLESDFVYTDANVLETAQGCVLDSKMTSTEQGEEAAAAATPRCEKGTVAPPPGIFL